MLRPAYVLALAVSALLPTTALADRTITATGSARVAVMPANRNDDASIRAAVAVARKQAIPAALADARDRAGAYAAAAAMTLGPIQSVSDAGPNAYPDFTFPTGPTPFPISFGPGGIQNFCGVVRQPIFRGTGRHRTVVRVISHQACYVPPTAFLTLTVTFAAT
jgi:hypothetical protein